jgi:hypothetical protein
MRRIGEVCMMLRRPDDGCGVPPKHTTPSTLPVFRPGIHPAEDPVAALYREIGEETGLQPHNHQLLFTITYQGVKPFVSYAYLCDVSADQAPITRPRRADSALRSVDPKPITRNLRLNYGLCQLSATPILVAPGTLAAFRAHRHIYGGTYLDDIASPRQSNSPL